MKKWGFLLLLTGCLVFVIVERVPFFYQHEVEIQQYEQGASERVEQKEIRKEQLYQGNLILVNAEYPVQQEGVRSDIVNLYEARELTKGYTLLNSGIYLSTEVALAFSEMVAAAEQDGVQHFVINSGFRDFEEQGELYQTRGADYALPAGYSEHNVGVALDVGSTETTMYEADEGIWIEENAWKYGFILRYPKDKTEITGIEYEPWHIRYVGLPHSAVMKEKNFVLEEYLAYLKEEEKISITVNGESYTVAYYPYSEGMTIPVPDNHEYELSGDNSDGVIVTVFE